ncbi:non-ribosomal peptide synthetase [Methylobacter sp.]|uniref:non-ribosomal peptide synthetase n=1 Tax=Methylobacter sp. TaxID=2051955 RepID=UPI00120E052B|nr:non-ribosomal peptide synthetase [Methylobacter sp.]TAK60290.1 MAG: amino acid adenylation domain-containing protein [Methylobacter sp.]
MSLQGLMQKLADNRVEVWLEDGKLRYRAPKQSMTEALMAELKANKQALIDYLEAQQQQPFALTYGQRALWFLHQTAPNSAAYNVAFSARILSAVDTDKMNQALSYLAERHAALKLRFREQAGEPEQFISPEAAVDFQLIDAADWDDEALQQQVNQSYETPFNLNNQQPLFRVRLFKRSPQQYVLLLVFHHIIGDGWSLWLLLDELAQVYSALAAGRQPELPALSSSYRQFAEQQVARVDSGELEQDWHYWRDKFAQTPPLLSLPAKRPFPAQRSYQGASYPLRIDSRTLVALKSLTAELGVTLYVLLLSAYQLLLHRCGGQQQLCVGTPLAGRDDDRYAEVVGYFVNPLPLLSELNAEQTVADFIKACRQEVLSAMAHQAFPLALVLERLSLSRDTSRPPLFQAAFVFQQLQKAQQLLDTNSSDHAADKTVDWGGLSLAPYTLFQQEGQFDLSLELMEAGGDLIGSIKFNTDILDVDDAERLADYYLNILKHLPDYKDSKAVLVPLLNKDYQQQLLRTWNDTSYSYPDTLIPELLSRQAQQTPDAIALVYEQSQLSYAELEQRSNQLAHYLRQQGVGIESLVAVCMERSLEMVISLHAIVKAGAAYVPLDPDYPQERLDYMIVNAGAELCLTQQALTGKLGNYPGRLLCVETLQTELAQQSSTAPTLKLQPDNIAYLIYTSGSTGQPKGVANNHQALANRINWMQLAYGLSWQDTVLQKTPYSFDVSVWEFFWPLITGAKLVIAKPNGHKDSHYLAQLIQTRQINTLHFVPSMLQAFIEEPEAARCASLKRIICSGEALPLSLQQQVYSKLDAQLYNLYGPTEAAIDVSEWHCRPDDTASSIVAIGKPIDNIQLYILDSQLQPVPVGVSGELYIAGIGLARGYHRKAQLTSERFIPNPFGQGERMYRTGDICRYRTDGVIEYQGREDGQVKLRGFRIELGEIEAVLKKHLAVQNCVLTADQFRGEKALLAYITLHEDVENTSALIKQIREFMQGFLPDYMLPAGFMVLPALPLSNNGKVDRKALPAMELVSSDEQRTAPENDVQQRIADIWQQLLKHRDFGIHTNFFHVGGHSLLALRLIAKLTEAFQTKLSIEDVFNHSSIEGLSRLLDVEHQHYQAWPAIKVQHRDHAPLAFSQERLWFVNTLENAAGVYHIPLAFHLRGQLNKPALTGAIEDLVNRHQALRTKIVGNGHSLEQQVLADVDHSVSCYSEDQVKAQGLEHIVRQEANATLDLSIGQVFKAALLDVDEQHSLLLLVMHHIISDGWSVNVLLQDLSALYRQHVQNSQTQLPELPVQYTDYCRWQRQLSDEGWFNLARDYWLAALQDAPTTLVLNYDHSRPMLPSFRGAMQFSQIPAQTRASLQAYAKQRGATDFMLLLSAFSVLLYRYSGQLDFMIGTPVANRDKVELHDLVGLFVNTLLMRIKIDSNQSFEQLLDVVKTTAMGAYEHQYYPFEGLVEALQPERNLAVTPLFQVMFVYQGQEQQAFSLAGLDVQPMVLPSATAKCDLTLYVTEEGDDWSLAMEYSTDLFEQASIEQLLSAMATVLDAVAKNPALPLARISVLTTAQQTKVLKDWNATDYSYPDSLIPELLSRQAQQTPDAVALVFEQAQLTYAELEQRSNRLAHYLRQQGVGIESLVAVCMERCLEMVISLHAIVKAGAAYVPLDPDYPQERLDYMIQNAGAELCLTQQALTGKLGDYPGRLLCIEVLQTELAHYPGTALELKLQPDNIAYLIYTSGSTGQPKGVANNHQALANRINWMQRAYGLSRQDTVLQKTPYSFDVSVWEFFWPLITGAKLVIAKPNGHKDSHYLAQLIQTQQINTLHFVPSMLQAFIEEPEAARCASLKRIICSGEALPLSLQQQVYSKLDAQLYNLYGPTEAAIDVSEWHCRADDTASSIVAIGKPIDNIQLYILDSQLQPVPVGVSGELYIAGIGLARGYYRKAQLTAERFIPNPFGQGERMYRTGDICRYRADGVIEYQGREDGQVKLRGFRIELGEIESVLKQHPGIQDAAVKVWEQGQSKRLVAYLVSKTEDLDEAVKHQVQQLPDYMRPSQYVRLEQLPLTASGKLDRKALAEPEIKVQQQYTAARNALEQTLVDIWQEVLKQDRIGIDDNYFELGGDSILSIQIVARARQAGLDLRVEDLFLGQTISELAGLTKQTGQQAIKVNTVSDQLPLSPTQEGMLFHALYEDDKAVYCQQIALEFSGHVQADLFKQAWWAVFEQHESLRRVFIWQDTDKPYQALNETGFCSWQELDWSGLPVSEQQQKQAELQTEQAAQGFDVSRGPLSHLTLIKLAEQHYYLLWSYHHLLMDGWSLPLVLTEVAQQYQALLAGQAYQPKPTRPFADYIHWLAEQDQRPSIEYWQQQLSKIQAATALPCVEQKAGTGYADQVMVWDAQLSQDIKAFVKQQRTTLAVLLQAAWALILNRYSSEQDVVFGMTVSGRPPELPGIESVVGLFINTIPVTAHIDDQQVGDWLQSLTAEQFKRDAHAYLPLNKIIECSGLSAGQSLFQSLLVLENYPLEAGLLNADNSALKITDVHFKEQTNYPLTLVIVPGERLHIKAMYQAEVFAAETISRVLGHFKLALNFLLASGNKSLADFQLVQAQERELYIDHWNETNYSYPSSLIPELLSRQAQQTPDAIALVYEQTELTYAELEQRSNRLAHYLTQQGVGIESLVAVCMERSLEMVTSLHAIVKAGAAYVPLDPDYPQERLDYMIANAGAQLCLTQQALTCKLGEYPGRLLCIETLQTELEQQPSTAPTLKLQPDNIAYLIYTSGSTGQPKGVANNHQALANRINWMQRAYGLSQHDTVLQKTPYSFDVSVWEFFWPLITGAKLVIAKPNGHKDSHYLAQLIQAQQINTLHFVPSMLQAFIEEPEAARCSSLKRIICSGEALPLSLQQQVYGKLDAQLYNLYGPTEAAIDVSEWPCRADDKASSIVAIGKPIDNIQLYILDSQLQPVPVGVSGELYIAGIGLARGYHRKAGLTAERFIPNPFGQGERMYRTGDICRYRADGVIEYQGREDGQVKLRGFRIELGEIESVLKQHPDIQDAAVKVWEQGQSKRLVAYLVSKTEDLDEAVKHQLQQLPDYMRPSQYVRLDKLPLTSSGKLDRKALAEPEIKVQQQYTPARNELEQTLVDIWQDVLKQDRIGIDDNYFELGGDSILSIQIVARARQAGISLDLKQIFVAQTIAVLAESASVAEQFTAEQGLVMGSVPCTPIQHYFFSTVQQDAQHFNQSVLLEVSPDMDPAALRQALATLLEHHDVLRMQVRQLHPAQLFIPADYDVGRVLQLKTFTQAADLTGQAGKVQASFELTGSPLLRVVLFTPADKNSLGRLLLVLHHLLVDGVSWRILLEDLHRAYQSAGKQQQARLPKKTTAFIDWAARFKQWSQTLPDQDYWLRYCQQQFAQLPLDHSVDQTITLADTKVQQLHLDSDITRALMQAPRALQVSVEEVLLAALLESLWQWLGKKTLSIELEGHGRENLFADLDVSRTVGWFTTLFPLAVEANHDMALTAVKSALRDLPNRGLSYGALRYLTDQTGLQQQLQAAEQRSTGIRFNYLGRFENAEQDSVFIGQAQELRGEERSGKQAFGLLMDFNSAVHQDCLQLDLRYSPLQFNSETIEQLLAGFKQQLIQLLRPVTADQSSHFALAKLSEQRLKNIAERGTVQDIYPLSPLQHGLLFHSVYAQQSSSYLQQVSWHFNGELNVELWRESWQQLIQRHPILRTGFDWLGAEQPLQVVFEQAPFAWQDIDYSNEDQATQQQLVDSFLQQDKQLPFDIKAAPLLRFALLRLGATHSVFVWSYHHILLDGWSLPKLIEDIFSLYAAKVTGQQVQLPERRPFHDYIAWLQDQDSNAMETYWRNRLNGFSDVNKLAIDLGGDSHIQQTEFNQSAVVLDQDFTAAINGFAQQQRVTVNIVLQAAWVVLLSCYCSSRDVLFGLTVSGRPAGLDQVGDMLGLFINTVPVRAQLAVDQTLEQLLQQLMIESLEREPFSYVQLAELQRWSQVQAGQGLFDSLFIFENYPMDETLDKQSSVLQLNNFQVYEQTDLPLTLLITPGKQLALKISYQQQRFEAQAVQRLLEHFQGIIERMISAPQSLLTGIGLLQATERQQLLLSNDKAVDQQCLPGLCLHQLIAQQAQQSADKVAVQFADWQLTYAQLEQQSDLLALQLLALGITTESIVAICMPRCVEMPVALLAVLKTGAAYLPLDLNLPAKRMQYMVEDSGAVLVLVKGQTDLEFPVKAQDVGQLLANRNIETQRLQAKVSPDNLAYVIYTSGSTGKPKAVQVSHKNIVNFMLTMADKPGINADDRLLAVTTLAFDIAALELYLPLTVGATVVLADSMQSADGHTLQGLLQQHDITVMQATPASWRLLLASGWQGNAHFKVLCGGEALPINLAEQLQRCAGQVWNVYGPTETTVWSSRCLLNGADKVKLGEPLANTRLYIVDENMNLLPAGFPGELMIAGEGVARGYKNRADLTAERFIPDPFSGSGERMYRTGDQVVRHEDGSIEYLGRLDFQAKIRGYRIELGEIEARLEDRPDIDQAVAVVDQSREDNQQLLSYYRGQPLTPFELRDYLSEYLPAYMLPTEFIHVQTFALTHSGKVDRKALPKPQRTGSLSPSANQPQTQTQKQLQDIWRQVLQREDFGTEDNFFDLGGHSLLLMQVWNLLQQQNKVVQTVDLFRYPSIAKLAAYLDSAGSDLPDDSVTRAEQKAQRQKTGRRRK